MTLVGYSLNDTMVVFDRVRENFRKVRRGDTAEIMDLSMTETLSRTIITSGLTFVVVVALFHSGRAAHPRFLHRHGDQGWPSGPTPPSMWRAPPPCTSGSAGHAADPGGKGGGSAEILP